LHSNQIQDISVLTNLPNALEYLDLSINQIQDVSVLRNLPNSLLELDLNDNQIQAVSALKILPNSLYKLDLGNQTIPIDVNKILHIIQMNLNLKHVGVESKSINFQLYQNSARKKTK
jgi:Leucine-rich repeat (LRR) protein